MEFQDPLKKLLSKTRAYKQAKNPYIRDAFDVSQENLEAPTNQIDYYSNQLQQNGVAPQKPGFFQSLAESTPVKVGGKALQVLLSPLNALYSGVMGGMNEGVKGVSDAASRFEDGFDLEDIPNAVGDIAKSRVKLRTGMAKGFAGGLLSPYSDKMAKEERSFVDVINTLQNGKSKTGQAAGKLIPRATNPYLFAKLLGASEKSAEEYGKVGADVAASILLDPLNGITGVGNASKAILNGSKGLEGVDKIADANKALNAVRKANGLDKLYDTYHGVNKLDDMEKLSGVLQTLKNEGKGNQYIDNLISEVSKAKDIDSAKQIYADTLKNYDNMFKPSAEYLQKKALNKLGAMPGYEGIKIGDNIVISAEKLRKLGDRKLTKYPSLAVSTLLNPAGTIYGAADPAGKLIRSTKLGEHLSDMFTGGKNSVLEKLARENPEMYMETLASQNLKRMRPNEKILNKEVAYKQVKAWADDMTSDEADDITRAVEKPVDKKFVPEIETETILNPEFLQKAAYYNKSQIVKAKKQAEIISKEFDAKIKTIQGTLDINNKEQVASLSKLMSQKITLENNISEIERFYSERAGGFIDLLEKQDFFDDAALNKLPKELIANPNEAASMSVKELSDLIQEYTGATRREANKKAMQLKKAADAYIMLIEDKMPGYSKYFKGTESTSIRKELGNAEVHNLDLEKATDKELEAKINELREKSYMSKMDNFSGVSRKQKEEMYKSLNKTSIGEKEVAKVENKSEAIEDVYKKTKDNYDTTGLSTKEQQEQIEKLHKQLGFEFTPSQKKMLEGLDEASADKYLNNLQKQMGKRQRLSVVGHVTSKESGLPTNTVEEIDRLSSITGRMPRVEVSDERVSEGVRIIEKARLERVAYEEKGLAKYKPKTNKLSPAEYKKLTALSDSIAYNFGRVKQYEYLAKEGDNLVRDLSYLNDDELKLVEEALSNRRNNPFLRKITSAADMPDEKFFDEFKKVFNETDISKEADKHLVVLNKSKFSNAETVLKDADDDVLEAILFKQEKELNTGAATHGKSSDFDELNRETMIERIRQNYEESVTDKGNLIATDKQVQALKNTVLNSYEKGNKYYNEIATILGDTKSSKNLIAADLTRNDVNNVFKLVKLEKNLQMFERANPKAYKKLLESGVLSKIDYKAIKAGKRSEVLETVDNVYKTITEKINEVKANALTVVQKAYFKQDLERDAKLLYGLSNNANVSWAKGKSAEILSHINSKNAKLNTMAEYLNLKNRTTELLEAVKKGEKSSPVRKLIINNEFGSTDVDKMFNVDVFDTPKGRLKIDVSTDKNDAKNVVDAFENNNLNNVSSNISTTATPKLSNAGLAGENVVVNPKDAKAAVPHETAHIAFDGSKGNGDRTANSLSKHLISLSDEDAKAISDITGTSVEDIKNGHISNYVASLGDVSKRDYNHEQFAELSRIMLNNPEVKTKLDTNTVSLWEKTVQKMDTKEFVDALNVRKTLKDELTDKLDKVKSYLNIIEPSRQTKYEHFTKQIKELEQRFSDNEELVKAFEKNVKNPKAEKFKTLTREIEKEIEIQNYESLSDKSKRIADAIKADFRHMGVEEGLFTDDKIDDMANYFTHMLNPDLADEVKKKGIFAKLGLDMSDPYNIFSNRKLSGTIEEINKYMYDKHGIEKFFETNALKSFLMRKLKHEDLMYKKKTLDDMMNLFSHKTLKYSDFNKMEIDDLEMLSKKLGFEKQKADIPDHFDRTHKYVEDGSRTTNADGSVNTPYTLTKTTNSELKQMYINGYKKWIEEKRDSGYVFATFNKEFEKKQVKTVSDEALEKAQNIKADINSTIEATKAATDDVRQNMLNLELDRPLIALDPKDVRLKNMYEATNEDLHLIPKRVLEDYEQTMKASFKQDKNALLDVYDKFLNTWKASAVASPSFHINNAMGNAFNSYLEVGANILDPKKNMTAIKILRGKDGTFAGYSLEQIKREAEKRGLLDTFFTVDFEDADNFIKSKAEKIVSKEEKPKVLRKLAGDDYNYNPLSNKFVAYQANQRLGSKIERQSKLVNFLTHIENGKSFDEAADLTNKVMFDYSDLTSFEHDVMKRVFPFYTFIRKNVPLQIEKIAEHPEVYNKVTNAYKSAGKNLETERERDVKPGEYNSRIPIGGGKYLNLSLPMFDADKASSPSDLYNMSNPLLKLAPELVMGKNSFTGGDIDNTGKHILESLIPSTKGIKAPVNIKSLDVPLRERQMLYEYLNKLQKQYYSAKNDGIIKEENGGQANTTSGIKSDPLKMLLQNSKKAKAKTKR